jgi:DNA-binding FrmR family transcriptional regulator
MDKESSAELDAIQQNVMSRLRRIEGQVRGLQRMVCEGKECEDILVQVRAVSSALKSTTGQVLRRYVMTRHERAIESQTLEDVHKQLEETTRTLNGFLDD